MTDGILLAETQGDPLLAAYDTIIIDEAHERSLNIDFLLGYLKQLLARRPDLKVIITSATLDADRFARHFGAGGTPAPVIEVSGRMYPVEVRYRPLAAGDAEADDEEELEDAIVDAVEDLWRQGPGDILVFLPGEREIRETSMLLTKGLARRPYAAAVEILPLFARLSVPEQQRVFAPSRGRRLVLATNVAETSLTVPGIRYVIDGGLARVKRYSVRNKTTLLQIEKISQASADQRAGRCGRVADGICVRLYGEDDYAARPKYTDPEILRSSLAAVILRMGALALGDVEAFPFVEPPGPRAIADGFQLLHELGAVDAERRLTPLGRELARLPVDPRVGRMVLAAREHGCVAELLVIASALSVPDPRERPLAKQQAADQAHLLFRDDRSDFLSLIALWQFFDAKLGEKLTHRRLVDACRGAFRLVPAAARMARRARAARERGGGAGVEVGARSCPTTIDMVKYQSIHTALLAGLIGNIGALDGETEGYAGARGIRFFLHPGSGLAKKRPKWVLAAELVETSRLFARCAARIEPEWIEAVAGERVTRDYFEPRWDAERGEVVASERVQLYGLTLVPRRRVSFGAIDPKAARDVFIREALVPGALATKGAFLAHNRKLVAEVARARAQGATAGRAGRRRRDRGVLCRSWCRKACIRSRPSSSWRAGIERDDPKALFMTREALMRHAAAHVTEELFPERFDMAGAVLPLKYRFAPGQPGDGLTLTVPLALLNQIDAARVSWLVPGLIREKVTFLLKALPKALRNRLAPLPDTVTAFLEAVPYGREPLADALRGWLRTRVGRGATVRHLGRPGDACASRDAGSRDRRRGPRARDRPRHCGAARAIGRGRAAVVRQGRTDPREARTQVLDVRRPAGDARDGEARAAADGLPGARRRRRQRLDHAARHSRRGRCSDARRRGPPAAHRAQIEPRRVRERRWRIRAGGAAIEDDDPDRQAAVRCAGRGRATAPSSATIRCRDRKRRSPSRRGARGPGCRRWPKARSGCSPTSPPRIMRSPSGWRRLLRR